ncbi:hypothetical protein STENM327S_08634 [Streptomyces tendae]
MAGDPPRLLPHGGLVAVVSHVPEADFSEEALRAHLEDLDWLTATARAHQQVVDALTVVTTPLPLRLATVFRDDSGVRVMLEEREAAFRRTLDRLDGRVEWGVKVYVEAEPADRAKAERPAQPAPRPASGRDYLRQRRRQSRANEDLWSRAGANSPPGCTRGCPTGPTTPGCTHRRIPAFPVPPDGTFSMPPIWWPATHPRNSSKRWTVRRTTPPEFAWNSPAPGPPIPSPETRRGQRGRRGRGGGIMTVVERREIALVDLLDRLLAGGVVITGDVTLRIADVDLVRIDLNALISSVNRNVPSPFGD